MSNARYTQFMYSKHSMPVRIDCNFIVDSTNTAGITSLKGPGVSAVYMNTGGVTVAPANPAAGIIYLRLQDNYFKYFGMNFSLIPPVTGAAINISGGAVLTIGQVYQITSVGTSTAANWQAAGLPAGLTPAVGMTFMAKINGGGTGTGQVKAISASNIALIQPAGNPNSLLNPIGYTVGVSNQGGVIMFKCLDSSLALAAPAAGTQVNLELYLSNSSVVVQGE